MNDRAAFQVFNLLKLEDLRAAKLVCKKWEQWISKTIWPKNYKPMDTVFEETAKRFPDNVCMSYQESQLTYKEVNARANQLAHYLKSLNLDHEARVGVYLHNSPAMFIAILAIWKAGLVYVPFPKNDQEVPTARLKFYVEDCKPSVMITTEKCVNDDIIIYTRDNRSCKTVQLDESGAMSAVTQQTWSSENTGNENAPNQLAYIIYNSGSKGKPIGVMTEHKGLVQSVASNSEAVSLTKDDRVLQIASVSFDAHLVEFGMPFATCGGAALHIMPRKENGSIVLRDIGKLCSEEKITICIITPPMLDLQETDHFKSVRAIISTGEKLYERTIRTWAEGRLFLNGYGPKEVTIVTTLGQHLKTDKVIHIGKAIRGLEVFLIPIETEERGKQEYELAIAGYGLARGFLNDPASTNARYVWIKHPKKDNEEVRVYMTGDIAREDENQSLEFICRYDGQMKLYGKLIRVEETQKALNDFSDEFIPHVDLMKSADSEAYPVIIAYLFKKNNEPLDLEKYWDHLTTTLSGGMNPTLWYELPQYEYNSCLNASNKIHAKPLAEVIQRNNYKPAYLCGNSAIVPRDAIEKDIATIWMKLLKIDETLLPNKETLYIDSHFYHLGGTSLLTAVMLKEIEKRFPEYHADEQFEVFMRHPTIASLALTIRRLQARANHSAESAVVKLAGHYPAGKPIPAGVVPLWMPASLMGNPVQDYPVFLANYQDKTRPVFGLKARGMENPLETDINLTTMAEAHLDEVYAMQAHEPYLFCGWSAGGVVASEMARIAQTQGKIAFAVMIDSEAPACMRTRSNKDFSEKYFFKLIADKLVRMKLNVEDHHIQELRQRLQGTLQRKNLSKAALIHLCYNELVFCLKKTNVTAPEAYQFLEYLRAMMICLLQHDTTAALNSTTLVAAEETSKQIGERLGWPDACQLTVVPAKGNHFSIMLNAPLPIDYAEIVNHHQRQANQLLLDTNEQKRKAQKSQKRQPERVDTYQVLPVDKNFVERDHYQELLVDLMQANQATIHLLSGKSGSGKSTLAQACLHEFTKRHHFTKIIWLNGQHDLSYEFRSLADYFHVPQDQSLDVTIKNLWNFLRKERVLLAIDNVATLDALFTHRFIQPETGPEVLQVVVTSQQHLAPFPVKHRVIGDCHEHEAIELLRKKFVKAPHLFDARCAEILVSKSMLNRHPFALAHAATYMLENQMTMEDYIKKYQSKPETDSAAVKAIQLSVEALKASCPKAYTMLEYASFLNSSYITKALLQHLLELDDQHEEFKFLIRELKQKNLIGQVVSLRHILLHDLVQGYVNEQITAENKKTYLTKIINTLISIFSTHDHKLDPNKKDIYSHCKWLLSTFIDSASSEMSTVDLVRLYQALVMYVLQMEEIDFAGADQFITRALAINDTLSGEKVRLQTLMLLQLMTKIKLSQDVEAEKIATEILALSDTLPEEKSQLNYYLGYMYFWSRDNINAKKYLTLGKNIPQACIYLGIIEFCSMHYDEASRLMDLSVAKKQEGCPMSDLEYAEVLMYSGTILSQNGRMRDALSQLDQALILFEKHYGTNTHIKIMNLYTFYAQAYEKLGLPGKAITKIQLASSIKESLMQEFGMLNDDDRGFTLDVDVELCRLNVSLCRYREAERQFAALNDVPLLQRNPNYMLLRGAFEAALENYDAAKIYYQKAMDLKLRMSRQVKEDQYLYCKLQIAKLSLLQGNLSTEQIKLAESEFSAVLEEYKLVNEKYRTKFLEQQGKLFQVCLLIENGEGNKAFTLLNEVEQYYIERYGSDVNKSVVEMQLLKAKAMLLVDEPEPLAILKWLEIVYKNQCDVYGLNLHADIAQTLACKAKAYFINGDFIQAKQHQQSALEMLRQIYPDKAGKLHSKVANAETLLATYGRTPLMRI